MLTWLARLTGAPDPQRDGSRLHAWPEDVHDERWCDCYECRHPTPTRTVVGEDWHPASLPGCTCPLCNS